VIVNAGTLALVVYHGVTGVTTVVDDYVRSGLARGALRAALWIGGLALLAYGWRGLGVASP
jgi:succinate dehydrogenase hydrophobic anchor subunit